MLVTNPNYYIYCASLERRGFELVLVVEDDEGMSIDGLEAALDRLGPRRRQIISFIYVVTVNNPSGRVLSNPRRRELVEVA